MYSTPGAKIQALYITLSLSNIRYETNKKLILNAALPLEDIYDQSIFDVSVLVKLTFKTGTLFIIAAYQSLGYICVNIWRYICKHLPKSKDKLEGYGRIT